MNSIILNPLEDEHSRIELIGYTVLVEDSRFFADQMPLLAARVSYAREGKTGEDEKKDSDLLEFLARNKHMSPFEHQYVTFLVSMPLFVMREMQRHRSLEGFFSWNEESMRYTDDPIGKVWIPKEFRKQSKKNKQGSDGEFDTNDQFNLKRVMAGAYGESYKAYDAMNFVGTAREQARGVVPMANYSRAYVSGTIRSWDMMCILRDHPAAQPEIRAYAKGFDEILAQVYPKSWGVLRKNRFRLERLLKHEFPEIWAQLVERKEVSEFE